MCGVGWGLCGWGWGVVLGGLLVVSIVGVKRGNQSLWDGEKISYIKRDQGIGKRRRYVKEDGFW